MGVLVTWLVGAGSFTRVLEIFGTLGAHRLGVLDWFVAMLLLRRTRLWVTLMALHLHCFRHLQQYIRTRCPSSSDCS